MAMSQPPMSDEALDRLVDSLDWDVTDEPAVETSSPAQKSSSSDPTVPSHSNGAPSTPKATRRESTFSSPLPPPISAPDHSTASTGVRIGFCEDRNKRCRRTMEDAHAYFAGFNGNVDQSYYAIFDGHAGKTAAKWCGDHLHEVYLSVEKDMPYLRVPERFHVAFTRADHELTDANGINSGCTAIVALIRVEPVLNDAGQVLLQQRHLYTANVGDARAVLDRRGTALRLSFDHKGNEPIEAKRVQAVGGFVMNGRVNGVLAVTRALGDHAMKEFVSGAPFTCETVLEKGDDLLILACDGLWDVCTDQEAVQLVHNEPDPQIAAEKLLSYALNHGSTDNLSVMCVRIDSLPHIFVKEPVEDDDT